MSLPGPPSTTPAQSVLRSLSAVMSTAFRPGTKPTVSLPPRPEMRNCSIIGTPTESRQVPKPTCRLPPVVMMPRLGHCSKEMSVRPPTLKSMTNCSTPAWVPVVCPRPRRLTA